MSTGEQRISWPRGEVNGTPVVGWRCQLCGYEIERPYTRSIVYGRCPQCGPVDDTKNQKFEVEPFVEKRRQRLAEQLAARYGPDRDGSRRCRVCDRIEDVRIDPGHQLQDLQWRCDRHRRFEYYYWWQAGDVPGLLARKWIEICDDCGAEFTDVYGVTYRHHGYEQTPPVRRDLCLRCVDPQWLTTCLES